MKRKEFDDILGRLGKKSEGDALDTASLVKLVKEVVPDASADPIVVCAARDYILLCAMYLLCDKVVKSSEYNTDYVLKLLEMEEMDEDGVALQTPLSILLNDLNKKDETEKCISIYKNLLLLPSHERKCALYMACHSLNELI